MSRWNWREQREKPAFLALADGTILRGYSVGAPFDQVGEVVFNTGMTGYQEILSDPSYAGQFVTMTYTEIGNYGVTPEDAESRRPFINGFIVHNLNEPENFRSRQTLGDYLREHRVPAIAGIDTRALTCKIRDEGTQKAFLSVSGTVSEAEALERARAWEGLDGQDYAARVSIDSAFGWDPDGSKTASWGIAELSQLPETDLHVVAYDFGIKWNILRGLRRHGMKVTVVPGGTSAAEVLSLKPDGVFFSNGPADPAAVDYAQRNARDLIGKTPIMGICLGNQLLGIACGGSTYRLKFGHHGCNHPVMDLTTQKVEITSQNHNFALDMDTLDPKVVEVTHVNLNDNTVEGIAHRSEPMFAVQYHPEAAPGPHDPYYLFQRFRDLIVKA